MELNFFTATEAAQKLGISKELMARYVRENRLDSCIRKGRVWFIPASSLKTFQNFQKKYRAGRPKKRFPAIFWREARYPPLERAVHMLATRAPFMIPKIVPKAKTQHYISSGKTKLERIIRKTMIEALYTDHRTPYPSFQDEIFKKLYNIVNRKAPADVYDLCQLHEAFPSEFKTGLSRLSETEELSELLIRIHRCMEVTDGQGTKEILTENGRKWMEGHAQKMIKEIVIAAKLTHG